MSADTYRSWHIFALNGGYFYTSTAWEHPQWNPESLAYEQAPSEIGKKIRRTKREGVRA